ncbi:hypothetical protein Goklo_017503, partial [Gossypium klotzschianum]|nr:hypothetical protein [Gossypium klotzschianum]
FDDTDDYKNVLTGGPWVVYGNYLTVHPWSLDFSSTNADMSIQVVWIRLPGLLEGFYSKVLLTAIGQIIGPVIKLNINTNLVRKGQFTRLAVCVDLQKLVVYTAIALKVELARKDRNRARKMNQAFGLRCWLRGIVVERPGATVNLETVAEEPIKEDLDFQFWKRKMD